jgi:hypothetical protein
MSDNKNSRLSTFNSLLIPSGYKQTEVGMIPKEWAVVRIDEIADVDSDNLVAGTAPDYTFNYISLEDVDEGVLRSYSNKMSAIGKPESVTQNRVIALFRKECRKSWTRRENARFTTT